MEPGLDGAEGDLEFLGDLGVTEALEVGEKEDLAKGRREAVEHPLHELISFSGVEAGVGGRDVDLQEVHVGDSLVPRGGGEIEGLTTPLSTEHVPAFVRRDGEKPGPETTIDVE